MSIDDVPDFETNCDEFQAVRETHEPDKRLANWERWLEERKRIHRKFERNFGRRPSKLLVNAAEDRKEDDEKRRVVDYARIPVWDKYRGNPMGWMLPPMLSKQCPHDLEYRITLTLPEKGLIPEIEYVKVPDVIKEEKGVVFTRNLYDLNKSEYFAKMFKQERVLELVPHKPEMREIAVIGKPFHGEVSEDRCSCEEIVEEIPETPKASDYLLSLNSLQLFPNDTGVRSVKLFLEGPSNTVQFLQLTIHNNSNRVVRFVLKKYSRRRVLGKITSENYDDLFFWNKNIHVLQPGEKIDFSVYFKSKICGSYTQTLQMQTKPNFWDSTLNILIIIQANVIKYNFENWCWEITLQLENQIRYRMVAEALDSCVQKIPRKKSEIVKYTYDKAAIFESVNAFYSNSNFRIRYLYDKNVVDELERFYESVRLDRHPETWDCRVETLRTVTKHRENHESALKLQQDLEDLRKKIDECGVIREKLEDQVRSFWEEKKGGKNNDKKGGEKKKDKSSTKSNKSKDKSSDKGKKKVATYVERARPPLPKTLSDDLEAVVGKLRSPTTWKLERSRKTQLCYALFCAYIDKICAECTELEVMFGIIKVNPKVVNKIYVENDRIYDEKLDESNMQYPRITDLIMTFNDKPAPPWSSTIPLENYEERFAAFKAEKTKLKPSLTNPPEHRVLQIEDNEELDEMYVEEEEENIPPKIYDHYKNNLYIIFNRNLWMLVDDMLATFELVPQPQIKLDVLRQIRLTAEEDLGEDEDEVRIFDLKKAISDVLKESEEPPVCTCECVCEINQSLLDLFTTYQSKPCALSQTADDVMAAEAARARAEEFRDVGVMTTPSIDIPPVILYDGGGVCAPITEDKSVDCICKSKSWRSIFHYYDSATGFHVPPDESSSDEHSCKTE